MNAPTPRPPTLWIDISDIVHYLRHHTRPSGIQRVAFEICRALLRVDNGAGRIRFTMRDGGPRDLVVMDWQELEGAFSRMSEAAAPKRLATLRTRGNIQVPGTSGATVGMILATGLTLQGRALLQLAKLPLALGAVAAAAIRRDMERRRVKAARAAARAGIENIATASAGEPFESVAQAGDWLLVLGSPWFHPDYVKTARWARDELRLRFAILMHDLIPIRRPEWCDRAMITAFSDWHRAVLPIADQIFANSRFTANDVTQWLAASGSTPRNTARPIPMGTGLPIGVDPASAPHLPPAGTYVLFVSTIEARKNHTLLFRVWRRLLSDLPRDQVPTLVFAGNIGWLVADLIQQLHNAAFLDGKIVIVQQPSDAELIQLYRGCRFTVFPSYYEGWGLPVSESLAMGQPCIASNTTALPESGGAMTRYFDPDKFDEAYAAIRAVIEDPADLEAWRAQVRRDFRPVTWDDSATVIRETIDALG
ncbi:MAG TPA: glycosyltransferase family 1 protein [Alphaproteobacteria bacterium]|nr:glycosyltransferase family 1 protein [Alphaproteobacteria bacterium]